MDPNAKDLIDAISKVLGVLGVFVAIFVAWWQVGKNRRERKEQAARDDIQRRKELEVRELQIKVTQAAFWLELRKMFAEHNDVHFDLRPGGSWYQSDASPSASDLPKVEAYMGLFEHCQRMIDDGLLDLATFKHIYAYRIDNLLSNSVIVREKLIKRGEGWKDFLQLVKSLDRVPLMLKTGKQWLQREDGKQWLATPAGQRWVAIMQVDLSTDVEKALGISA